MAIHNVRLPDAAGTPRIVIPETPTSGVPPVHPLPADAASSRPAPAPDAPVHPASQAAERAAPARDAEAAAPDGRAWYRSEAWLAVELAALFPVLVALVAPQPARIPLVALSAVLVTLGLTMLVLRDRRARAARSSAG